ncbi:MAG: hypothetical protein ACPGNT_05225, partial [Rhodospirillales bacterium]
MRRFLFIVLIALGLVAGWATAPATANSLLGGGAKNSADTEQMQTSQEAPSLFGRIWVTTLATQRSLVRE